MAESFLTFTRRMVRSEEMTRWSLDHDADPNARCDLDITPFSIAIQKASLTTIKLILQGGGDIRKGQLLHFAIGRTQLDQLAIIDTQIASGAVVNARMFENDPPSWLESRLLGMGTPLHEAAELGHATTVAHLLHYGPDVKMVDSFGRTALDVARAKDFSYVVEILETKNGG